MPWEVTNAFGVPAYYDKAWHGNRNRAAYLKGQPNQVLALEVLQVRALGLSPAHLLASCNGSQSRRDVGSLFSV